MGLVLFETYQKGFKCGVGGGVKIIFFFLKNFLLEEAGVSLKKASKLGERRIGLYWKEWVLCELVAVIRDFFSYCKMCYIHLIKNISRSRSWYRKTIDSLGNFRPFPTKWWGPIFGFQFHFFFGSRMKILAFLVYLRYWAGFENYSKAKAKLKKGASLFCKHWFNSCKTVSVFFFSMSGY